MTSRTFGFPAKVIADLCGVSVMTARRWKSGLSRVPYAAAALLLGDLGALSNSWHGWRIVGEEIISPDGWRICRNDALAVPLMRGQLEAYREEIAHLRGSAELDDQPLPGQESNKIVEAFSS